jgi:transcriptional regulator with XRE-family HTH domain
MLQLVVTDQGDSLPRGPTLFYVLELPPLPVGNVEIKLNTSTGPTLTEVFRPAMDFACMRFWIDVDHELGSDLHSHLSRADQDLMREHAKWARRAAASVIEARRSALKISQDQFARLIGTSVDTVIGIEVGEIAVNAALLDQIEVTFARRERAAGFTPHEMSPRLARLLAEAPSPGEEPRTNGAAPPGAVSVHVQSAPQPRTELPMLAEPPESENSNGQYWEGGAKLRDQRKRRGLSLVKFAQMARMKPSHLSRLERGDLKPTPEVDARIKLTINTVDAGGKQVLS